MEELLKDPTIETVDRFNISTIIQNQQAFAWHQIIIRYLKGLDTRNEINDLPNNMKGDVRNGKYKLARDNDLLLYQSSNGKVRICLPPEHVKAILKYTHENMLVGGHMSANAMIEEIKERFYWSGFCDHIKEYVDECQCTLAKRIPDRKVGKMVTFEAKEINEVVAIDHVGTLPRAPGGYRYITTYYDKFSGYTKSIPTKRIDAFSTAVNFIVHWVYSFGPPKSMLTDLGSDFRSEIMAHLLSLIRTKHKFTTAHHSRSDGGVERFNRTLQQALRAISIDKNLDFRKGDPWNLYLGYVNCVHNNKKSSRTNMKLSPNEIFIGRKLRTPIDFKLEESEHFRRKPGKMYEDYVKKMIKVNNGIAKKELEIYKAKQKEYYDKNRKKPDYKVNDLIMYWSGVYPAKGKDKLAIHWKGPYRIIKTFNEGNVVTIMNVRYPQIIHNANVDKIMRFKPKREWEFNQYGQRIRRGNIQSDVSFDIEMESGPHPYHSEEEKQAELSDETSKKTHHISDIEAESQHSLLVVPSENEIPVSPAPKSPPPLEHLSEPPLERPIIEKEDTTYPKLPSEEPPPAPNRKRKYEELEANIIETVKPPTKRQRQRLQKYLKKISNIFSLKKKVKNDINNHNQKYQ